MEPGITGMDFFTRRTLYKNALLQFLAGQPDLCLLTGIPGNIGDSLICAGTEDLLTGGQIPYRPIPLHDLDTTHFPQSTLLIPGSGALTKPYHEWLPASVLKASQRFSKVVLLPSSYDVTVPIVAECLTQENVYPLARETGSYRLVKVFGRAALSYDCAVYFHRFDQIRDVSKNSASDTSVLLALREDHDSLLHVEGLIPNPEINEDISRAKTDLNGWIETITRASTIITDRLHVAIATVLFGKKLIYLDPATQKVSRCLDFTFRDTFCDRIERCSPAWLLVNGYAVRKEVG